MIVSLLISINLNEMADAIKWICMIFPHYSLSDALIYVNVNNTRRTTCSDMCNNVYSANTDCSLDMQCEKFGKSCCCKYKICDF